MTMKRNQKKNLVITLAILMAGLLLMMSLKACQNVSNNYINNSGTFYSYSEALQYYNQYLMNLQGSKANDAESLAKQLNNWRIVSDTVYHYLMIDSIYINNVLVADGFDRTHDKCREEFIKMINAGLWSYSDIVEIKRSTSSFSEDNLVLQCAKKAQIFYDTFEEPTLSIKKELLLEEYSKFLFEAKHKSYDMNEMLYFIRREDIFFRTFLAYLDDINDEAVVNIAQDTDSVCGRIMLSAKSGMLDLREAVVFLSIRTGRRLIQNSRCCLENIGQALQDSIKTEAYKWMIVQPFVSIDQLAMATMPKNDMDQFKTIATKLYKSQEFAEAYATDLEYLNKTLTREILKMYVLTL